MNKLRSLSQTLTCRIMSVVLVMIGVITICVYMSVRTYMVNVAQERYENISNQGVSHES